MRNLFRSTAYHNTLTIDGLEQNEWAENNLDDLFWFKTDRAKAKVIEYNDEKFVGEHSGFGNPHRREIHFNDDCIEGTDFCEIQGKKKVSFIYHLKLLFLLVMLNEVKNPETSLEKLIVILNEVKNLKIKVEKPTLRFFATLRMTKKISRMTREMK
jgi:hypothetical protein